MVNERQNRIAARALWKTTPIVKPHKIQCDLCFRKEQFEKIKAGCIPSDMEEKWFIFYEDGHIYFHRSWTGAGIFDVPVTERNGEFAVSYFLVERDAKLYRYSKDDEDRNLLCALIYSELLAEHSKADEYWEQYNKTNYPQGKRTQMKN